jgi:hypothetical protein
VLSPRSRFCWSLRWFPTETIAKATTFLLRTSGKSLGNSSSARYGDKNSHL